MLQCTVASCRSSDSIAASCFRHRLTSEEWKVYQVILSAARQRKEMQHLIWKFLPAQKNGTADDNWISLPEYIMFFLHSCLNLITISIRVLESKAIYSTEVYEEMLRLRMCLNFWMDGKVVFVSKLTVNMKRPRNTRQSILRDGTEVCKKKKTTYMETLCFKCSWIYTYIDKSM